MRKTIIILGLIFMMVITTVSAYYQFDTWTEVQPEGDNDITWEGADISDDGSVILLGNWGAGANNLFLSIDSGNTFNEVEPKGSGVDGDWYQAKVSPDGSKLIAGDYGGHVYVSDDEGSSWTQLVITGDVSNWQGLEISNDGQHIVAVATNGNFYVSTNGGTSFSNTFNSTQTSISDLDVNGQYLASCDADYVYISDDYGLTFTNVTPPEYRYAGRFYCGRVSISSDGQDILTSNYFQGLHYSSDGGNNWDYVLNSSEETNFPVWMINDVVVSNDGSRFYSWIKRSFYTSENGVDWTEINDSEVLINLAGSSLHQELSRDFTTLIFTDATDSVAGRVYVGTLSEVVIEEEEEEVVIDYAVGAPVGSSSGRANVPVAREEEAEEEVSDSSPEGLSDGAKKALGFAAIAGAAYFLLNGGSSASSAKGRSSRRRRK